MSTETELIAALKALVDAVGPAHIELTSVQAVRQMAKLMGAVKKAEALIAKAKGRA